MSFECRKSNTLLASLILYIDIFSKSRFSPLKRRLNTSFVYVVYAIFNCTNRYLNLFPFILRRDNALGWFRARILRLLLQVEIPSRKFNYSTCTVPQSPSFETSLVCRCIPLCAIARHARTTTAQRRCTLTASRVVVNGCPET